MLLHGPLESFDRTHQTSLATSYKPACKGSLRKTYCFSTLIT